MTSVDEAGRNETQPDASENTKPTSFNKDSNMRFIHDIYLAKVGESWTNERLLSVFEPAVERLSLDDEAAKKLRDFVRYQLVGKRSRQVP